MQGENDGTADLKFDFSGKTVFVTGASRGIGREIAHAFARDGARLILSARTAEALAPVMILYRIEAAVLQDPRRIRPGSRQDPRRKSRIRHLCTL